MIPMLTVEYTSDEVRKDLKSMHPFKSSGPDGMSHVFINILRSQDINIDLFSIIFYMVWYYQNKAVFEGVRMDEVLIFRSSTTLLTDYCNYNAWPERFPTSLSSKLWKKPPARGLRVFFDGPTSRLPAGGTGVFISDETSRFIHGASKFYAGIDDPLVVEMLALHDALRLALQLGLHSFSLLGDSQETILAANGEMDVPIICASVLKDISSLLLILPFLGIHCVRRSENLVAHELVFYAKTNVNCNESWPSIPEGLFSISTG